MCRLAAFPPGTTPDVAHDIATNFVSSNTHGVGSAYVDKGEFKLHKYPISYQEAVSKKEPLFKHMPYKGWTIFHVRYATHGDKTFQNTHPIIKGDVCVVHNGIFSEAPLIRWALADSVKWQGETDSEVAAYLLNKHGLEKFKSGIPNYSGVFVALKRDGTLEIAKTGGDLKAQRLENDTFIIASQFPQKYRESELPIGTYKLDKEGHAVGWKIEKKKTDRWERYDRGDISQFRRGCFADAENYCTGAGYNQSTLPLISNGRGTAMGDSKLVVVGSPATKKEIKNPELWDWMDEQEMLEYIHNINS